MSRNEAKTGTTVIELLNGFEHALRTALPGNWGVELARQASAGVAGYLPDAIYRLKAPGGELATIVADVKYNVIPRDLTAVTSQLWHVSELIGADTTVLISPFVSPLAREKLAEAGVGWFDATGNLQVRMDQPAVFLSSIGASRNPFVDPADHRLKSLRGPASARVVRALCELPLPLGVRMFGQEANVGGGSSSRVLELLSREGLITREDSGRVVAVRKRALIQRWTDDYGLVSSNHVTGMLDPRGIDHALTALRSAADGHVVTGSVAARAYLPTGMVPVTPLTTLVVHTDRPVDLIRDTGLRQVERGANVLVVKPFDEVLLDRAREIDGIRCAAPAQVVADLLTGPGRSSEEAEQLIKVLATEDQGWMT
ncbi:MAG TPA: hypothetical protein VJ914_31020 [Pseudonocardiaceae bacterium]|nr:hypothetical protein [Pseudonocardiaceae bacterium]